MKTKITTLSFIIGALAFTSANTFAQNAGLPGEGPRPVGPIREHRQDIREHRQDIRQERRDEFFEELPVEVQEQITDYKETKQALREELRVVLEGLEDPTDADARKAAIEQFKADNADTIEAQKAAAEEIRLAIQQFREDNPPPVVDGGPTPEDIQERREQFQAEREARRAERREFLEYLDTLDPEEREAAIQERREEIRAEHEARREERRENQE